MRMWMIDPAKMCRRHLLGEHVEMHMFVGSINKGVSMAGYCRNGLLEPTELRDRHDALVAEMKKRGINHKSPLPEYSLSGLTDWEISSVVDVEDATADLISRCQECRELHSA